MASWYKTSYHNWVNLDVESVINIYSAYKDDVLVGYKITSKNFVLGFLCKEQDPALVVEKILKNEFCEMLNTFKFCDMVFKGEGPNGDSQEAKTSRLAWLEPKFKNITYTAYSP